jgi:hypothetical protein
MKLAEALLERKRIKEEIYALRMRAIADARVQEGDKPSEDPAELAERIMNLADRLEKITVAVNRTNMVAKLLDGRTLMEAIACRDILKLRCEVAKDLADAAAGSKEYRTMRSEIKFVPAVDVAFWRKRADGYAKAYRELDAAIQAANWSVDMLEE